VRKRRKKRVQIWKELNTTPKQEKRWRLICDFPIQDSMISPMNPHSLLQSIFIKPRPSVFTCDMGWARF